MDLLQKIALVWQKVNLVHRALLAAVLVASVLIGYLLVHWARRPDMRMLYQELSPAEASQITERISEQDIPYQLRDGGTTVYVPKAHVYQLRLDLAKDGLPVGEQSGYKLFDDEKIGVSPFVQNVNLKRALQDELAKSIQMIDGVAHARVHIVTPEQHLFASEEAETSASVVLQLRPGYRLSSTNIAAITHMVSGSIKGLKSERVTVVDSQGHLLSSESDTQLATGAGTVHDYKERVEQGLVKKAEDLLTAVLGPGRATVRVSAVVDMNSISTITETYDPVSKVPIKEEIVSGSESGAGGAQGQAAAGTTKRDETSKIEYQVGKTVKQEIVLPGEIKSLSVAAFVDLSVRDPNAQGPGGQPALIMQVTEVEEIIRTALGLKTADSLKVVHAQFHQPAQTIVDEEPSAWPKYLALARQLSLGIMAFCALIVFRIFSKARGRAVAVQAGQLPEGGAGGGLLPGSSPATEPVLLRRQITHALRNNPEQVREMFLNWIEEKE
jgi:flagellar M-ring protein FliF